MTLYESAIRFTKPSLHSKFTQWQENLADAQATLYESNIEGKTWFIGTSLSKRLDNKVMNGYEKFAYSGMSILDALKIANRISEVADTLVIEMNVIERPESIDFEEKLLHPIHIFLNRNLVSTRQAYQPVGLLSRYILLAYSRFFLIKKISKEDEPKRCGKPENIEVINQQVMFGEAIKVLKNQYSNRVDEQLLFAQLDKLKRYIRAFQDHGTKILFFEMPVNHQLTELDHPKAVRESFRLFFPESEFTYLPRDTSSYQTTDGVHLSQSEATKFSLFIKQKLDVTNIIIER